MTVNEDYAPPTMFWGYHGRFRDFGGETSQDLIYKERIVLESGQHKHPPSVDHGGIRLGEIVVMMAG